MSVDTYQTTRFHQEHNFIGIQRLVRLGDISGPMMPGPSNLSFRVGPPVGSHQSAKFGDVCFSILLACSSEL